MGDVPGEYERHPVGYSQADEGNDGGYGPAPSHISNVPGSAKFLDPSGAGDRSAAVDTTPYAFHSQYTSIPQAQQRSGDTHASSTYGADRVRDSATSTFNLGPMATALPDYASPALGYMHTQPYQTSSPFTLHQLSQMSPYPGPAAYGHGHRVAHAHSQHPGAGFIPGHSSQSGGQLFSMYTASHQRSAGPSPLQQSLSTFPPQLYYYPTGYDSPSPLQQPPSYSRGFNMPLGQGGATSLGTPLNRGFPSSEPLGFGPGFYGSSAQRAATQGNKACCLD